MIDELLQAFKNQFFTGVVGGTAVVSLLYVLKEIPGKVWELVRWRFTCTLTVFNEDAAFERVSEWLNGLDGACETRHLRLTSTWDSSAESDVERPSPGLGTHLFWYRMRPLVVRRTLPDKSAVSGSGRLEDIRLLTIGSSPDVLRDLVTEIQAERTKSRGNSVEVYTYRNSWRLSCRKPKRKLETVVLANGQQDRILSDVRWFLGAREWYYGRGIPYRRGYLFEGPPGCGKTSAALGLAGVLCRPVYALNLGGLEGDDQLIDAISSVPEHAMLLIEDIDAVESSAKRVTPRQAYPTPDTKADPTPITLSAMLNALDGAFAREGRILVMTTNHPEKIDQALIRPGRADKREHIGLLERDGAVTMASMFLDSAQAEELVSGIKTPIAAAELQEILVSREESMVVT